MSVRFSIPLKPAFINRVATSVAMEGSQSRIERGFSLIEVMVALIVLSVGLLGLAGLQSASLRSTYSSYVRTQAGIAAMEMAERMRANKTGVDTMQYQAISSPPAGTAPTSCLTSNCLAAAMAAHDAYTWLSSLADNDDLLSARGTVTCLDSPCAVGSQHRITVMWDGKRSGATGTGCDQNNSADLTCHRITVVP
ncbi:type IV pilus modification protein PilV [Pseudomonadota bacterium]